MASHASHSPEIERFFNATSVFEVVKNQHGYLELNPVLKDSIRPIALQNVKNTQYAEYSFCQIVNGKIVKAFRKDEIAFVPKE